MMYNDHSIINNRLINFDPIIKSVLNSTLNIVLPPNFIIAPTTKPTNTTIISPGDDTNKKNPRKRKTADGDNDNNHMVKNTTPIKEFLLKEEEDWSKNFAGKCTSDCPKWGNTDWMCTRWWVKVKCFHDCGSKASHVGACTIPPTKRSEFQVYLTKVHREMALRFHTEVDKLVV
jgi:hypothetical protein